MFCFLRSCVSLLFVTSFLFTLSSHLALNDLPIPLVDARQVDLRHELDLRWAAWVLLSSGDDEAVEAVVEWGAKGAYDGRLPGG